MKATARLALTLVIVALSHSTFAIDKSAQQAFDRLLLESGLRMDKPEHYIDIPTQANPVLPYERAIQHESGALEVRFIIRPLNRIMIDYTDPHNAAPEPNHLFPLLFESITTRLSAGGDMPSSTFSSSDAESNFNAQWAAATVFDVVPEFSADYRSALLIAMHKNQLADAYTQFLYNDHEQAKTLINAALSTLAFIPATTETQ